ncbi:MAG: nucleotidyltransferase family protein [Chloroflexota bacterium]|nr:nucleotidyltransferase family protein [Chloroflexota bacterium]
MAGFGAIILAAGLSSRMVENKLLLPWTDGEPIINHVLSAYVDAGVDPILVVTGRDADRVAAAVAAYQPTLAHNPDFATGEMLSSVKAGLRGLREGQPAVFIQPGDMPCITSAVISQLAAEHEPGFNVAPLYKGQRGHPVLLDRAFWGDMLDLPAGARPREVLAEARERLRLVDVDDAGVTLDLDTREAYERALGC